MLLKGEARRLSGFRHLPALSYAFKPQLSQIYLWFDPVPYQRRWRELCASSTPTPYTTCPCPKNPPGDSQRLNPSWWSWELPALLTLIAVVIHQDDLLEQGRGGVVDGAVHRAQDHRQRLVHEDEDDGDLWKVLPVFQLFASATRRAERDTGSAEPTGQRFQPGTREIHTAATSQLRTARAPTACKPVLESLLLGRDSSQAEHPRTQRALPELT